MNKRNQVFNMRMVKHQNRLFREVVECPFLERERCPGLPSRSRGVELDSFVILLDLEKQDTWEDGFPLT